MFKDQGYYNAAITIDTMTISVTQPHGNQKDSRLAPFSTT